MQLRLLPQPFGVLKLTPPQPFPEWLGGAEIFFIARTEDEYSIMCPQKYIPTRFDSDGDWRCFRVEDVAIDEVGVVARASKPLADDGMTLLLVSTHDRDYVLVAAKNLQRAIEVYTESGFPVQVPE